MRQFFSVVYKFFQSGNLLKSGKFNTSEQNLFCSKEMKDLSEQFCTDAESDHVEIMILNVRKISKDQFDSEILLRELMKE